MASYQCTERVKVVDATAQNYVWGVGFIRIPQRGTFHSTVTRSEPGDPVQSRRLPSANHVRYQFEERFLPAPLFFSSFPSAQEMALHPFVVASPVSAIRGHAFALLSTSPPLPQNNFRAANQAEGRFMVNDCNGHFVKERWKVINGAVFKRTRMTVLNPGERTYTAFGINVEMQDGVRRSSFAFAPISVFEEDSTHSSQARWFDPSILQMLAAVLGISPYRGLCKF